MSRLCIFFVLIIAMTEVWIRTKAGFGMDDTSSDGLAWYFDNSVKSIFTTNGRAVNIPAQSNRLDEGCRSKLVCSSGSNGLITPVSDAAYTAYGKLPLYFIQNDGQMDERVKFYEKGSGHTMYFTEEGVYVMLIAANPSISPDERSPDEICPDFIGQAGRTQLSGLNSLNRSNNKSALSPQTLEMPDTSCSDSVPKHGQTEFVRATQSPAPNTAIISLSFIGANKHPKIVAEGLQKGKINYFIGNNPEEWRTNIPTYSAVVYKEIYDGIDIKFYGNNRHLEYDIIVRPGADPSQVRFAYKGGEDMRVNENGDMEIIVRNSSNGLNGLNCLNALNTEEKIIQKRPYVYQEIDGERVEIEGRFRVLSLDGKFIHGFHVTSYDTAHTLIIDPILEYSTYIGGNVSDLSYAIAVDSSGSAYITGYTQSSNFPVVGTITGYATNTDTFVTKIGTETPITLAYSTYIGGSNIDYGIGIAVDGSASAYITGYTYSSNFPRVGTSTGFAGGSYDAFVTRLGVSGDTLEYSSFIGGNGDDLGQGIAVDSSGSAYVVGYTTSANFPRVGTSTAKKSGEDVFVTRLGTGTPLALIYSTYIGGSGNEHGRGIAMDGSGSAYITGYTASSDFPVVGTSTSKKSGEDAFVTKLGTGTPLALIYSTYIGGSDNDYGRGIAVDGSGSAYITGYTQSNNFPRVGTTTGYATNTDAFVTKLSTETPLALIYSTYIGGSSSDASLGIAVDSFNSAYITGYTQSSDFPIVGTTTSNAGGSYDAFVTKLGTETPLALIYSTYIGGSGSDVVLGIAVNGSGSAYITGYTDSNDFPRVGTTTGHAGGSYDAFITKLAFTPGVTTGAASGVTTGDTTLSGVFNGFGLSTTAFFQYGIASGVYTGTSSTSSLTGSEGDVTEKTAISGLSAGTTYYYRAVANNVAGTSAGSEESFTTTSLSGGGGGETEKLTITSTNPSNGATGVSVTTSVSATFNMYVNGSTVTTETFKLSSESGEVGGYVATNGKTITFIPSEILSYNTEYTARVTKKIQAANFAGTTMESDYTWSFTTESEYAVTPTPVPSPVVSPMPSPVASPAPSPIASPMFTPPQTGRIAGQVTDAITDTGINGATVSLDTGEQAVTGTRQGQNGAYEFTNVAAGEHTVTASSTGYIQGAKAVLVTAGGTADGRIALAPLPPTPSPVTSPTPAPELCEATKLDAEPEVLKLRQNRKKRSGVVTVTVTGEEDCPSAKVEITAVIAKGKQRVSVSPSKAFTDANGRAKFTIKAKKGTTGKAKVRFEAGGLKDTVTVVVRK